MPGLEDIAAGELRSAGADITATLSRFDKRDGIVLFTGKDLPPVLRCGTLEDVFKLLVDAPTPRLRSAPKLLAAQLDRAAFEAAATQHHRLRPKRYGRSYKVVARVAGRHPFVREDVERAFERAIASLLPRWAPTKGPAAMEIWAHVAGDRTIAGLRLSGDEFAQRAYKRAHLPASLKPSVARALVLLSEPRPDDVMIDPMCGAGTLLRERADAGRARRIIGGDVDYASVMASRSNAGRQGGLFLWDATCLPLARGSVDVVIANPPYGRRHEATAGIDSLYQRTLREVGRVLRSGGRCVVLTAEPEALQKAAPSTLRVRSKRRILLRGLMTTAFVLVRP